MGDGGSPKISQKITGGRGGSHQKITEDHKGVCGWPAKEFAKLKVLKKEIITPRISYSWVVQEVSSSQTNIDLIRIALTKRYIFWKVV